MHFLFTKSIGCFQTPFTLLVALAFVLLKGFGVAGFTSWPWICVLIPILGPLFVAAAIYIAIAIAGAFVAAVVIFAD